MNSLFKETKKIGAYPSHNFMDCYNSYPPTNEDRRKSIKGLSETKSLLFIYDSERPDSVNPVVHKKNYKHFYSYLQPVMQLIANKKGPGYFSKIFAAELPAGSRIQEHIDPGFGFVLAERFHWAVQTNTDSYSLIHEKKYSFTEGSLWSFNNKARHYSVNDGQTSRIHIIFDYVSLERNLCLSAFPLDKKEFQNEKMLLKLIQKKGLLY